MSKSGITYLHKQLKESLKDGKKTTEEEVIIDGPKGVTIKMYSKNGDKIEKITIHGSGDEFVMKTTKDGSQDEKKLTKSELMAELKKNKKLEFAADFAKSQKGGELMRSRRKSSKKASKKSSKKASKKASKKGSRKQSRAKKGSKKASKKGSRKH